MVVGRTTCKCLCQELLKWKAGGIAGSGSAQNTLAFKVTSILFVYVEQVFFTEKVCNQFASTTYEFHRQSFYFANLKQNEHNWIKAQSNKLSVFFTNKILKQNNFLIIHYISTTKV